MTKLLYEDITDKIISAAIEVSRELGPGLLESVYEACLLHELGKMDLKVEQQKSIPVRYKEINLNIGYRIDLIVEDKVIVELKTVEKILPVHEAQLLTYLKLSGYRVGLLINFNEKYVKDGIIRRII